MAKISFVIPVYNSQETLEKVVAGLIQLGRDKKYRYEIILVDDFSRDKSRSVCQKLAQTYPFIVFLGLAKNFGQHNALLAGLRQATGDIALCLDDDLQTPPAESPLLIEKLLLEDWDVVYAQYPEKKHSFWRNFGSLINDIMAAYLLSKPQSLRITSFFALKRFVIDEIIKYDGPFAYLPGLIFRTTGRIGLVNTKHNERATGKSNYTLTKLISLWLNGFTNFSVKPLRICTLTGLLIATLSFILSFVLMIKKILTPDMVIGWTSIFLAVSVFGGLNLMFIGLVGEYVGRIFLSTNKKPQSVIEEAINNSCTKQDNNAG